MSEIALLEAQKDREASWAADSAAAFMRRLESTDPRMTPGGKLIIKLTSERFQERLQRFSVEHATTPRPMQSKAFQVLMVLGAPHVSAVVLTCAVTATISIGAARDPSVHMVVKQGKLIGQGLEHDLRFRAWRKDAEGAEKAATERMRERMKGDPKTWRSRAKQLRTLATIPWSLEDLCVVGMDFLAMLVEAAPDVFESKTVRYGHKTLLLFRLTNAASERLLADTAAMSVAKPRIGMMLVPPMPWRYAEKTE